MAIFQPIDPRGPAQRGNQTLQELAQSAAQNVIRRQRMRALLAQGARGAAGGAVGGSNPFRSSLNARPTGLRGLPPHAQGQALGLGGLHGNGNGNGQFDPNNAGVFSSGGGGYDYPSLPDPNDPSQAPSGPTAPAAEVAGTTAPGGVSYATPAAAGSSVGTGQQSASDPSSVDTSGASGGLINLGNGLFYDPVTDAVHGGNPLGGLTAFQTATQGRPV